MYLVDVLEKQPTSIHDLSHNYRRPAMLTSITIKASVVAIVATGVIEMMLRSFKTNFKQTITCRCSLGTESKRKFFCENASLVPSNQSLCFLEIFIRT